MLPPEPRLPGARDLIDEGLYFVVHAPRQTGKTTTLGALARDVAADGRQVALLVSCERAQAWGDDFGGANGAILGAIAEEAVAQGSPPEQMPPSPWPEAEAGSRLHTGLATWARSSTPTASRRCSGRRSSSRSAVRARATRSGTA
jgi:hypothetical protein